MRLITYLLNAFYHLWSICLFDAGLTTFEPKILKGEDISPAKRKKKEFHLDFLEGLLNVIAIVSAVLQ